MENIVIKLYRNNVLIDNLENDIFLRQLCQRYYNRGSADSLYALIRMKTPNHNLLTINTKSKNMYINKHCNNPCNYCKKYTNVDYVSFDIPKFPYWGYNYPHMNFHLKCIEPIIQHAEAYIFSSGCENYKKLIYHYLLFTFTNLIKDIFNVIGIHYTNILLKK